MFFCWTHEHFSGILLVAQLLEKILRLLLIRGNWIVLHWINIEYPLYCDKSKLISSYLSPLTLEVVGAPQMTLQQYLPTLSCLPLPSVNLRTTFPSIPWRYLPFSSPVFLSFLLLSLSPAELSSPCQWILRCGHTIWVSVSLPWLGDHHTLHLHSGFCCEPPLSSHGLVWKVQKSPIASRLKGLDLSLKFCCQGSALTSIKEDG